MFDGKIDLTFHRMAMDLLTLLHIWVICAFQLSLSSICTPRNFVTLFFSISVSFILTFNSVTFRLKVNSIEWVLATFNINLLADSHLVTLCDSSSKMFCSSGKSLHLYPNAVPSTNCVKM